MQLRALSLAVALWLASALIAVPSDSVVGDRVATLTRASSWTLERTDSDGVPGRTIRKAWSRLANGCSSRRSR